MTAPGQTGSDTGAGASGEHLRPPPVASAFRLCDKGYYDKLLAVELLHLPGKPAGVSGLVCYVANKTTTRSEANERPGNGAPAPRGGWGVAPWSERGASPCGGAWPPAPARVAGHPCSRVAPPP